MMIQAGTFPHRETHASETAIGAVDTFRFIRFDVPFPPGTVPIVIPFVQTFDGPETPGLRIANVTSEGFAFRLNELVANDRGKSSALSNGDHVKESIGWVAISPTCFGGNPGPIG